MIYNCQPTIMNTLAYLKRINFEGAPNVNLNTFKRLHEHHLNNVPFENLDIQHNRAIILELKHIFNKVVENKRGGFCYEVNYLFQQLLLQLGYDVKKISAQIVDDKETGPEFDHLALIVKLNGTNWLADVGFGDLFVKPLSIDTTDTQYDGRHYFKIDNVDKNNFLLSMSMNGTDFEKKYIFQTDAKEIEQFEAECRFKQSDPSSYFVKNKIVTRPIGKGRKTIFNEKYTFKTGSAKTEFMIENKEDEIRILKKEFNITI